MCSASAAGPFSHVWARSGPFWLNAGGADAGELVNWLAAALWRRFDIPAGGIAEVRLRLSREREPRFGDGEAVLAARRSEADEFYAALQAGIAYSDACAVQRQAFAAPASAIAARGAVRLRRRFRALPRRRARAARMRNRAVGSPIRAACAS